MEEFDLLSGEIKTKDFNPNDTLEEVRQFLNDFINEKNYIFVDNDNNIIRKVNESKYLCKDNQILFIRTKKKRKDLQNE